MISLVSVLALVAACGGETTPAPAPVAPAPEAPATAPAEKAEAPPAPVAPARDDLPDVLLVTLDTLRADRVGAYGYDKAFTETLDALAERGTRYDRAYSPLPLTIPAHATMFTGLYPPQHGIRSNGDAVLKANEVTLAERLKAAGYRTAASVAAYVTTRRFGFDQGFDVYYDDIDVKQNHWRSERPADDVIADILRWESLYENDPRPRFAWVHLYDAHAPYRAWKGYIEKTEGRTYDAEVARLDDQLEPLFAAFDRPTLVVVVGDHGEGLGDHSELAHGLYVYDATQRVPMIMAGPGVPEGKVVSEPVSLADLSPTILDILDLPALEGAVGRSVRPAPHDDARPVYMESYQLAQRYQLAAPVAVVDGSMKLIDLPEPELYDLAADPGETKNLAAERPDDVARLRGHLSTWDFGPPVADDAPSAEVAEQLAALGYVGGGAVDPDVVLPDPKGHQDMLKKGQQANAMVGRGEQEPALELLASLTKDYPAVSEFWMQRVRLTVENGTPQDVHEVVLEALVQFPDNVSMRAMHAWSLDAQGEHQQASDIYQILAQEDPTSPRLRVMAVRTLAAVNAKDAYSLANVYLAEHPDDYNLAGFLGVDMVRRGDFAKALPWLERGLLAETPEPDVAFHLAAAAAGKMDRVESQRLLEIEVQHHPGHIPALNSLGRILLVARDYEGVLDLTESALSRQRKVPGFWWMRAQALFNMQRYEEARLSINAGLEVSDPAMPELLLLDANLLKQEGKEKEALARFEEAKAAKKAFDEAQGQIQQHRSKAKANRMEKVLRTDKSKGPRRP